MDATRGRERGQWWPSGPHPDGRMSATLYCPNCGKPMGLWRHGIDGDGTVVPSVNAPTHGQGYFEHESKCRFHGSVRLIGWSWGESPAPGREVISAA
jgi:hypothetical protein